MRHHVIAQLLLLNYSIYKIIISLTGNMDKVDFEF